MVRNKFYKNGQIKKEVEYIDNVKNGKIRWYYPNGELKGIGFYNDGKCDGDFITYYRNGKIKSRIRYKDGESISLIEYFEDEPKKKVSISEKKIEKKIKTKSSNGKKFLIIALLLVGGLIYTLFNLLSSEKDKITKIPENIKEEEIIKNEVIEKKIETKVEQNQDIKEIINVATGEKEEKIEKVESVVLEEKKVELEESKAENLEEEKDSDENIKNILGVNSIEKIERTEVFPNIPKELLTPEEELEVKKIREEENRVEEEKKEEKNNLSIETKSEESLSSIRKLQEIQQQTKLKEESISPIKAQEKKTVNQKKSQILQEIKTDEVNIDYISMITTKDREEVLKGIMKPKYNVYEDERYGYKFVYPYNIVELSNFQTKYLRGKAFSAKGGYLLGKLMVIPSSELKELRAYNIQQLFENELRSKYPIIEKNLDIEDRNYEIKFQMNNKYLERYVISSKNGDYYLFLTMEYNQILEKDLKKIIKKMKKELKAN